jgi:hypothetical protein
MNEKEKHKFYWWARLATADLNIPDVECQKLADFLEKLSAEVGLPAGELWDEVWKAYAEKLKADEDDGGEEWKAQP